MGWDKLKGVKQTHYGSRLIRSDRNHIDRSPKQLRDVLIDHKLCIYRRPCMLELSVFVFARPFHDSEIVRCKLVFDYEIFNEQKEQNKKFRACFKKFTRSYFSTNFPGIDFSKSNSVLHDTYSQNVSSSFLREYLNLLGQLRTVQEDYCCPHKGVAEYEDFPLDFCV